MMTRKQAKAHAALMKQIHGEEWLIFKTPAHAPINQYPANIYNVGPYATCAASDRAEYEAEGAQFEDAANA